MPTKPRKKPVILVLAGHDPGGGAGIQADIETIAANDGHAATVITCMTIQNTGEFRSVIPVDPEQFQQQINMISADMQICACKIGLITDFGILSTIEKVLITLKDVPVVLDPVIRAGTGEKIMTDDILSSLHDKLLPFVTVLTPNSIEARALTGIDNMEGAANELLQRGCRAVLITGTHEDTDSVTNTLYLKNEKPVKYNWERLQGSYHGSGCTLSSAIATRLAHGQEIKQAVELAQEYTWNALKNGMLLGKQQFHPDRFFRKS